MSKGCTYCRSRGQGGGPGPTHGALVKPSEDWEFRLQTEAIGAFEAGKERVV